MFDTGAAVWAMTLAIAGLTSLVVGLNFLWRNRHGPRRRPIVLGLLAALVGVLLLRSSFYIPVRVVVEGNGTVSAEPTVPAVRYTDT